MGVDHRSRRALGNALTLACAAIAASACAVRNPAFRPRDGSAVEDRRDGAADAERGPADAAKLSADAAAAASIKGDDCQSPIRVGTMIANQSVTVDGTTAGAHDDVQAQPCNGEAHPDVVYEIVCSAGGRLYVTLVPDGWAAAFVVHNAATCGTAPTADLCNQGLASAAISSDVAVQAGVPIWVWIDGSNANSGPQRGPFSLTLRCSP